MKFEGKYRILTIYALLVVAVAVVLVTVIYNQRTIDDEQNIEQETDVVFDVDNKYYGIDTTEYDYVRKRIEPNQCLSTILGDYNVSGATIDEIVKDSKSTYSVNKLRQGNYYTIFTTKDSTKRACFMEYDIDKINYVVYSFGDTVSSLLSKRRTDTLYRTINGEIKSSLWSAMVEGGATPVLTDKLSDIFAWTVDFFGIKEGDKFSVLYEEVYVEDEAVGVNRILAAELMNCGKNHCAYYYNNDDTKGYFNENGESLKRQFLKAPLKYKRISSGFSRARRHPVLKIVRPHLGVDYAAPAGTPVHSVANGTVIAKGWDRRGGGNYVKIKHNKTYSTTYMHLKGFAIGISVGTKVSQGQLIGYVGSTGLATGPHLDFRLYRNGVAINPLSMPMEPVNPISEKDMRRFLDDVAYYKTLYQSNTIIK